MPRYRIIEVPAWSGVLDTETGLALFTVVTKLVRPVSRPGTVGHLPPADIRARLQWLIDTMNAAADAGNPCPP